jgi:hypothetical protein
MRINTSKVRLVNDVRLGLVKNSFGGLRTPVDRAIFIYF